MKASFSRRTKHVVCFDIDLGESGVIGFEFITDEYGKCDASALAAALTTLADEIKRRCEAEDSEVSDSYDEEE